MELRAFLEILSRMAERRPLKAGEVQKYGEMPQGISPLEHLGLGLEGLEMNLSNAMQVAGDGGNAATLDAQEEREFVRHVFHHIADAAIDVDEELWKQATAMAYMLDEATG